ncbi:FixH family protein [Rhizobium sp. SSA_523]|uniref:FixH family protein n=1 Tax=Rhizobium sp. SSA_523 TaxID=2952477 RepID=UPI002091B470|nr:FixH family protein [Rhizobium sp. SSA_523]MCO5734816.1 FixH family protein [Rhizobium sp. SSA_523]WKC25784.1 FixH family protein [Rhizobium sp. SSA_523]
MNARHAKEFQFTGWHMLAVICLFFGTIISVNLYMAYQAVHSWSGIVVENTYVASQQFNAKVAEAKKLGATGIAGAISVDRSTIRYTIADASGAPVEAERVTASFRRPVGDHQDFEVELAGLGRGVFENNRAVLPGHWIVEISALQGGERILHHTQRVAIAEGGQ